MIVYECKKCKKVTLVEVDGLCVKCLKAQHQKELIKLTKECDNCRNLHTVLLRNKKLKKQIKLYEKDYISVSFYNKLKKELKELKEEVEEEFNKLIQMGDYVNGSDLEDSQKKLKEKGASK